MNGLRQVHGRNNVVEVCLRAFGLRYRTEFAEKLNVTKSAVRFWEHDDRLPPERAIQVARLARSEGIDLPTEFYMATGLPGPDDKDAAA